MPPVTLADLKREAKTLGITMCIRDGFVDLSSQQTCLYYRSPQKVNDPQALCGAWQWLQRYQGTLQWFEQICAHLPGGRVRQIVAFLVLMLFFSGNDGINRE
ncbi:hypothetical protein KSF_109080 [Reticulibacter mediterranei]|uniref:Uncharacterized protein n=1 Tax=Reticulibacter mediterranei TaxID=2778369 RepID=A0A8J3J211_9CHLR|nr:hypothetical protein [Reticulibacter mediterranei]GHP00861.1 hypothetical protein KSF_109080 [Reticulibacter mediterranei]